MGHIPAFYGAGAFWMLTSMKAYRHPTNDAKVTTLGNINKGLKFCWTHKRIQVWLKYGLESL